MTKTKKAKLPRPGLDAKKFQRSLGELAETIAYKIQWEGRRKIQKPIFVIPDIYYILRFAHQTCNLFFFMNADERRRDDPFYKPACSAAILPLVRTMIDCLYNITAILKNPGPKCYKFRESGFKRVLEVLDADEERYGGDPEWDVWIAECHKFIDFQMRQTGAVEADVRARKRLWPTLREYLRQKDDAIDAHQDFLRRFTLGFWEEYSGISHATFQGLLPIAVLFSPKDLPHERRPMVDRRLEAVVSIHLARVARILLCTLAEIQAYFRFDGARINERLHRVWDVLCVVPEIRELYDGRYMQLMRENGIDPRSRGC